MADGGVDGREWRDGLPVGAEAPTFGLEEWVALPELGLPAILAKTDSGARTSALHAVAIEPFGPIAKPRVRFVVHPWPERPDVSIVCSAPLVDRREIVSSSGETDMRHVIATPLTLGGRTRMTEVSLTDRGAMRYRMLLGRQAFPEGARIDPGRSFLSPALSYDCYVGDHGLSPTKRSLRLALLTMQPGSHSVRRLVAAAEARDHVVEVLETRRCYMNVNAERPEVCYAGAPLPHFDAVIPRIGTSITTYGAAVVRQFQLAGAHCLNTAEAITISRDKLTAHQMLARAGVDTPVTAFANSPDDVDHVIDVVGGAPLVVKLVQGAQGRGVVLADSPVAARSVIAAFQALDADILVQSFVAEARGVDVRAFVVGGKVVAAMTRHAAAGEFRANLHRGGRAEKARLTKAERDIAARATRVMGLDVAGVDLLRGADGPKVLEVNSSPGLEGIEAATGVDVADLIIRHIEARLRPVGAGLRPRRRALRIAGAA
jgi:ribosomal protein S6--L-glutamate ligase